MIWSSYITKVRHFCTINFTYLSVESTKVRLFHNLLTPHFFITSIFLVIVLYVFL